MTISWATILNFFCVVELVVAIIYLQYIYIQVYTDWMLIFSSGLDSWMVFFEMCRILHLPKEKNSSIFFGHKWSLPWKHGEAIGPVIPPAAALFFGWWSHISGWWCGEDTLRGCLSMWIFGMITGWWFGCHFLFSQKYWEFHHPNWRTHIFQRGGPTTNQIISVFIVFFLAARFIHDGRFKT